jgi:hypothetical protein
MDLTVEKIEIEIDTPKTIFIVPYRDRKQQYEFFARQMAHVLEGTSYRILYIHQKDNRSFNRGALKNIGFIVVKNLYPNTYRNITLVFNDIDTMPYTKGFFNYETVPGVVKHFYGFTFALGGIASMTAGDFERVNGFPNLWAWGYEDNALNQRVIKSSIRIDRTQFYPILDKNILHLQDGVVREVNRSEYDTYKFLTPEGVNSITNLKYTINDDTGFVDVTGFSTGREEDLSKRTQYDMTKGNIPFTNIGRGKARMPMIM